MSCWVVPSIAAEFLGIPLTQVLERARKGFIPTKTELGFTLVDVAPHSPRIVGGIRQPASRPATYIELPAAEVTEEERQALVGGESASAQPPLSSRELAELQGSPQRPVVLEEVGDVDLDDEPEEGTLDWRQARMHASRLRRAPRAVVDLAA
jgi:hypothetical protein